jgi:hypothetical protein
VTEGDYFATSRLQSSEWYEHCNIVSYYFHEKCRKNSLFAVLVEAVLAKMVSLRSSVLDGIYLIIRISFSSQDTQVNSFSAKSNQSIWPASCFASRSPYHVNT